MHLVAITKQELQQLSPRNRAKDTKMIESLYRNNHPNLRSTERINEENNGFVVVVCFPFRIAS